MDGSWKLENREEVISEGAGRWIGAWKQKIEWGLCGRGKKARGGRSGLGNFKDRVGSL